jgi:dihydrofolate reductase
MAAQLPQRGSGGRFGGDLVRQGLDAGLVDELCLTFLPLVLGRGIRLWDGLQNRNDLEFDPPVMHEGRMVQVTARVVKSTASL